MFIYFLKDFFQNSKMAFASMYGSMLEPYNPDYDRVIEEKEFVHRLKCPVCHLVPRVTPVWQCLNSHLTCKECYM
jgi:hypothetical protein